MATRIVPFTFTKDGIFYFTRRVPADLRSHYETGRISFSLRTNNPHQATPRALAQAAKLDEFWLQLRTAQRAIPGQHRLIAHNAVGRELGPTATQALETYLRLKSKGRVETFTTAATRAIEYLITAKKDKPLLAYSKADATSFRDGLFERGLSSASVVRIFTSLRAVTTFALSEHGLSEPSPFTGIYLDRSVSGRGRTSIPIGDVRKVQSECTKLDDDLRWLIALISDTGMRLSEAAGLALDDIKLNEPLPFVVVQPHPWRPLKTSSSARTIPLVGHALWASARVVGKVSGTFAFPRYNKHSRTSANAASAALNKWLSQIIDNGVVHSFRHSLRDRLRAIECPSDIVDQIGGWARSNVGESYGRGYPNAVLYRWMTTITNNVE